ncbi:MAG: hypothetical protein QXG86_00695 [Candidatus Woesearchaeota archaeon]
MEEKKLLKLALICSLLGVALLYLVSISIKEEEKSFPLIEENEYSVISGEVLSFKKYNNISFIKILQNTPVEVVVIGENLMDFKTGDIIEVRGKKTKYKRKEEFVAEEIRKVN